MTEKVLRAGEKKTLDILARQKFLGSFYMAGGTGCALHLGHRLSHDFDFFAPRKFGLCPIQNSLRNQGSFVLDYSEANTLVGRFDRTKISFFYYPYPLLEETIDIGGVRIASLLDIGCMKIDAISSRGTKRDFVDLYFILNKLKIDLKSFFKYFEQKYGPAGFNRHHVLKSLIYFDDADKDPEPEMLVDYSWAEIKRFFNKSVTLGFKGFAGKAAPILKAFGSVDFAPDYDYKKARRK
jgi:hypothetical protein